MLTNLWLNLNLVSFLLTLACLSNNLGEANVKTCGYASCPKARSGVINVHLVPHTHNDVGWLKTVEQYYIGSKENIQKAAVRYILDTVVHALADNPERKFSYVEMAFFHLWWEEQNDNIKTLVHKLVREGQLQFLLGGWSMNDEATTHYTAIIDQMTLGLDFLNQTFGECGRPLVAWQIDPFGHSIEQSNLFYLMGFDANIFSRFDYQEKEERVRDKRMEFLQNTNFFNNKVANKLFTSILYDTYDSPKQFCFDENCLDTPIMDDPSLPDYNILNIVSLFVDYVIMHAKTYTTEHILVPMGRDFDFKNAFRNFFNIDKLVFHVNSIRPDVNVMYSTPACYVYHVNKEKKNYTVKKFDFFPYASEHERFWTGYFTSRSALKGFIRESNNLYQACKQAHVISLVNDLELNKKVKVMGKIMGIMQHHDAVTGTSKQHVANDYVKQLFIGWKACECVVSASLSKLITNNKNKLSFTLCSLINISYCLQTDNLSYKPFTIVLYNSLVVEHSYWTRIPVNVMSGDVYYVKNSKGIFIQSQLIPVTSRTRSIPERPSIISANFELVFNGTVPPIGYSTFIIHRAKTRIFKKAFEAEISKFENMKSEPFMISNSRLRLYYRDNLLHSVMNVKLELNVSLKQCIRYYYSVPTYGPTSGAYVFRPAMEKSIKFNDSVMVNIIRGPLVTEVHQEFSNWTTLVTRLYEDSVRVESEWTIGPLPAGGKDVILHYETDIDNNGTFFTDSNSRQLLPRVINKRFDFKFYQTGLVAGNYYPVTSDVSIFDAFKSPSVALIIHPDRSIGAGACESGMIETMIHRNTMDDDSLGVGEPLNELGSDKLGLIVRGKQWFEIGYSNEIFRTRRLKNVKYFNKPLILFAKLNTSETSIKDFSSLIKELPENLHFTSLENHFTLENVIDYQIIRIENLYDLGSDPITFDLNKIFHSLTIISIEELNLSANQFLKDVKRLKWNKKPQNRNRYFDGDQETLISIIPGEIRTFKIIFKS